MIFKFLKASVFSLLLTSTISVCSAQSFPSLSKSLGIVSIDKSNSTDSKSEFKIVANPKIVNDYQIDLNDLIFEIEEIKDESFIKVYKISSSSDLTNFSEIKLKLSNGVITDLVTNLVIDDKELESNEKLNLQVLIAMVIFNETKYPKSGTESSKLQGGGKACDRTITSIRNTKSSATNHVNSATTAFITAHPDCSTVNGVDTGCLWGDYFCVATQEIHCTGGGCAVRYGSL